MPTLYDAQGQPLDLTHEEADAALSKGTAGFLKGQQVPIVSKTGQVGTVDAGQIHAAIGDGARLATDDELEHAKVEAKYGGAGGQVVTGVLGALSGASLSATDVIGSALGGREYIEQHREANPNAWLGGEVAGAIAPTLLSGGEAGAVEAANIAHEAEGLSALAKAGQAAKTATRVVGAPSIGVSKLGAGIEDVVRGALGAGEGGSAVAGLAKKVLAKGAAAAGEGLAIGGAQQIDEDVLGNHEINGEKVLAAMGHGALLGLGTGVALTAAGEIGSRIWGKAAPQIGKVAEEQAFRTLDTTKAFAKEADRIPGGVRGVGRRLLDEGLVGFGDRVEDIAPKIGAARTKAGEKIGSILEAADNAGFEGPKLEAVSERVDKEILPELKKLEKTNAGAVEKVKTLMSDLETYAGVPSAEVAAEEGIDRAALLKESRLTFKQAQDFRARLDDVIRWNTNPLGPVNEATEAMKKIRGVIESELEQSGERAANKMGGSFLHDYKEAKLAYRQLAVADKAATDAVIRTEANRVLSPSDYITGAALAHHGAKMLGGALLGAAGGSEESGGDMGGLIGGAVTGGLAALAHHALRTRGNSMSAVLLDRLSALRGVERAVQHVDRQVERGVSGFFREETHVPVKLHDAIRGEGKEHAAETSIRRVMKAASNSEAHAGDIERAAAPIAAHAPKTANSMQRAALRATMYLANAVPHQVVRPSITPQFDRKISALTDTQKHEYLRQVQAVHDPMTVLADMEAGRVTRTQVQALQNVYPSLYREVVQKVHDRLSSLSQPLDYGQKVQLSTLLGVPADGTLSPQFVAAMQSNFAPPKPGKGPASPAPAQNRRPLENTSAKATAMKF
jgi:hypothetical protein